MKLYCDNQTALYIVSNLLFHEEMVYIKIDYHFILLGRSYCPKNSVMDLSTLMISMRTLYLRLIVTLLRRSYCRKNSIMDLSTITISLLTRGDHGLDF